MIRKAIIFSIMALAGIAVYVTSTFFELDGTLSFITTYLLPLSVFISGSLLALSLTEEEKEENRRNK